MLRAQARVAAVVGVLRSAFSGVPVSTMQLRFRRAGYTFLRPAPMIWRQANRRAACSRLGRSPVYSITLLPLGIAFDANRPRRSIAEHLIRSRNLAYAGLMRGIIRAGRYLRDIHRWMKRQASVDEAAGATGAPAARS